MGSIKILIDTIQGLPLSLRPWNNSDIPSLLRYANNKAVADNLRDGFSHPYTIEDARRFLEMAAGTDPHLLILAIDCRGEAIGSVGATLKQDVYRKNIEIGYWLAEPFWGKGIMTTVIKRFTSHLWLSYDVRRIYAEPFANNSASRKALEKAGFKCEAVFSQNVIKNGVYLDSCIYSVLREDASYENGKK
ncbi:MAG: GNAT family protein [Bacteroidota bacterium]|jgi:[ribosomal protein S5]-alanine N-acetyltransferase